MGILVLAGCSREHSDLPTQANQGPRSELTLGVSNLGARAGDTIVITVRALSPVSGFQGWLRFSTGSLEVVGHGPAQSGAIQAVNTQNQGAGELRLLAANPTGGEGVTAAVMAVVRNGWSSADLAFDLERAVSGDLNRLDPTVASAVSSDPEASELARQPAWRSRSGAARTSGLARPSKIPGASSTYGDANLDGNLDVLDTFYAANLSVGNVALAECIVGTRSPQLDCLAVNVRPANAPGFGGPLDPCGPGLEACGSFDRVIDVIDVLAIALESVGVDQEVVGEPIPRAAAATEIVQLQAGQQTGARTLTADTIYRLTGTLEIGDPAGTTPGLLTIEAGTTVYVANGGIEVHPGSRIAAVGTPTDPVALVCATSLSAPCWRGLDIHGGGAGSDSGVLQHMIMVGATHGLVLDDVGTGTLIRGLQIDVTSQSAISVADGDVSLREILLTRATGGSGFLAQGGWTGRAQNVAVLWPDAQGTAVTLQGVSGSGPGPEFYNFTIIAPRSVGVRLAASTRGMLRNFVLLRPAVGLDIDDATTCDALAAGVDLVPAPWLIAGADFLGDRDTDPASCDAFGSSPNAERDYLLLPGLGHRFVGDVASVLALARSTDPTLPDLRPPSGSPADAPSYVASTPADGFFQDQPYFGAFEPNLSTVPWYAGWASIAAALNGVPGSWFPRAPLPVGVRSAAGSTDGTVIRVFGGNNAGALVNAHQVFDPATESWTAATPLPVGVDYAMAAYVNNAFHLFGGNDSNGKTAAHWVYDASTGTWASRAPIPTRLAGAAVAILNGEVWLMGGAPASGITNLVRIYDPVSDTWRLGTPLPVAMLGHSGVERGGRIHVVGDGKRHYMYDPVVGTWQGLADLPEDRTELGAELFSGQLCVFGGGGLTDFCYDDLANTWGTLDALPERRSSMASAAIGGSIFAIGGTPSSSTVSSFSSVP